MSERTQASVKDVQRELDRLLACSLLWSLLTLKERKQARFQGLPVSQILQDSTPSRAVALGFQLTTPREVRGLYRFSPSTEGLAPGWQARARQAIESMEARYGVRLTGAESAEIKGIRVQLARIIRGSGV